MVISQKNLIKRVISFLLHETKYYNKNIIGEQYEEKLKKNKISSINTFTNCSIIENKAECVENETIE